MFFIIEEGKEIVLDISQEIVKVNALQNNLVFSNIT